MKKGKMVVDKDRKGRERGPADLKDFGLSSGWDGEPLDIFEQVNMISFVLERTTVATEQRTDLEEHKDVKRVWGSDNSI